MQNDCRAGHPRAVGKFYLIAVRTLILYAWSLVSRSVDLEAFSEISGGIRAGRGAVSDTGSHGGAQKVNTGRDRRDAVPRDLSLLKALGGHLSFNPSLEKAGVGKVNVIMIHSSLESDTDRPKHGAHFCYDFLSLSRSNV